MKKKYRKKSRENLVSANTLASANVSSWINDEGNIFEVTKNTR